MARASNGAARRQIGIGLIGVGWMGRLHTMSYGRVAEHFPECDGVPRLVIAADALDERARFAVDRLGYASATTDPYEVINHPEVDAVSITGPNHVHERFAVAAAAAGKHVWAEKPLGRYPEETRRIVAAARAAGIVTTIGYNYRHAPMVQHARELVASGGLGDVRNYRGYFLVDYASDPNAALTWRFQRAFAGLGVLGDLMSHVVDMALWLAGPIAEVCAQQCIELRHRPTQADPGAAHYEVATGGPIGDVENEDYVASLVRFEHGGHGTFEVSRAMVGPHCRMGFDVHGTEGALSWDFERMNELELYRRGPSGADVGYTRIVAGPQHGDFARYQPGPGVSMGYTELKTTEAYVFLQSIVDGIHRAPSVAEAGATADVLDAIRASSEGREWVAVRGDASIAPSADWPAASDRRAG